MNKKALMRVTLFGFLFVALLIYRQFFTKEYLFPNQKTLYMADVVIERQEIHIPHTWGAVFNPGIIEYGDGYLMAFRANAIHFKSWILKKIRWKKNSYLCFVKLDQNFKPVSKIFSTNHTSVLDQLGFNQGEDPRLFKLKGRLYVSYNDFALDDSKRRVMRRIHVAEVVESSHKIELLHIRDLHFNIPETYIRQGILHNDIQKNWVPFVKDDELYFVFLLTPHVIIKADPLTGDCQEVAMTEALNWTFGLPRGGTPALPYGEGFISFFHSAMRGLEKSHYFSEPKACTNRVYYWSAYIFQDEYPYSIIKEIDIPLMGKDLYETSRKKIIFPSGLIINDRGMYLFYGVDDKRMGVMKIDQEKLNAFMRKVR